jgi:hypothetical protein
MNATKEIKGNMKGEFVMPQDLGLVMLSSGEQFSIFYPERSEFKIIDIAHSLSNICRFNGHCKHFYSVAQHSIAVKELMRNHGEDAVMQMYGLTHDVSEFVCADLQSTFKKCLSGYKEIEDKIEKAFYDTYDIPQPSEEQRVVIEEYDKMALYVEAKSLMHGFRNMVNVRDYGVLNYPIKEELPSDVKAAFFWEFYKLTCNIQRLNEQLKLAECV